MKYLTNKIFIFLSVIIFGFPLFSNAATLYIAPESKDVKVGDTFSVLVDVDSQGVPINAATADINFDNSLLSVQGVGFSNSIFIIWPEEPSYSNINGNIHFSGGIYSPGWNGTVGPVLRITFKAKAVGQAKLTVMNASILANDGIGTNVLNNKFDSNINISKAIPVVEKPVVVTKAVSTSTVIIENVVNNFEIPLLVNLPDQLTEGSILSFNGNGVSNGQILLYVQKGKNNPEITQISTRSTGLFNFAYRNPVTSGYYKIWARNILSDGIMSTSSDISYVEVINPNTVSVGGLQISYQSIITVLFIISVTLLVFWSVTLDYYLKLKNKKTPKKTSLR